MKENGYMMEIVFILKEVKVIEVPKTISYEELLGVVHHILNLDPTNCSL